jgi:hypothetical protein
MRLYEIAVALDQLVNAVLGGYADETMSARCWRLRSARPYSWLRRAVDLLFWFQKNHCQTAYESERLRSQLPAEYRDAPTQPASAGFFTPTEKGSNETE